jgi:hypothetical protein
MHRRTFFSMSAALGLAGLARMDRAAEGENSARFPEPAPLPFRGEKSDLRITAIRAVTLIP